MAHVIITYFDPEGEGANIFESTDTCISKDGMR